MIRPPISIDARGSVQVQPKIQIRAAGQDCLHAAQEVVTAHDLDAHVRQYEREDEPESMGVAVTFAQGAVRVVVAPW
jgi:hypothetical protein